MTSPPALTDRERARAARDAVQQVAGAVGPRARDGVRIHPAARDYSRD